MPPTVADRLRHIHQAIVEIELLLANKSRQEFADDRLLRLATERLLETVSEASRHIPKRRDSARPISLGAASPIWAIGYAMPITRLTPIFFGTFSAVT